MRYIPSIINKGTACIKNDKGWYQRVCFLFLFIGSLLSISSFAQIPVQCGSPGCTSNDVRIVKAYISDINGNYFTCSNNDPVNGAYLHLVVTTSTKRIGVFISATLVVSSSGATTSFPLTNCFSASLNGSNIELPPVALPNGTFTCGSQVSLTQVFTAWGTGTTDFCKGSTAVQCPGTPSKCRFVQGEVIFVQTQPCEAPTNITASATVNPVCEGGSTQLSVTYGNNQSATIQWESSTDGTTWSPLSGATSASLTLTGVTSGMNGLKYRPMVTNHTSDQLGTHDCPQAGNVITLTVNPASNGGTTTGDQSVCTGGTPGTNIILSNNVGNVVRWERSADATFSSPSTIGTVTSTTLTGAAIGAINAETWIRAVVKSGVCSEANSNSIKISIYAVPAITTPATATICSDGTTAISLTASVASSFAWTIGTITGGITGASNGSGSSIAQKLTNPGNSTGSVVYSVTPTSTTGSCPGSAYPITVSVDPKPAIGNKTSIICSGTSFTVSPVNGADAVPLGTTYTWSAPVSNPLGAITGGSAQAVGQSAISQTLSNTSTSAATLTYTVTPTAGSCGGSSFTIIVTVNPKPAIANAVASICSGGNFSVSPVNGTDKVPSGTTYSWNAPTVTGGITGSSAQTGQSTISQTLTNPSSTTDGSVLYTVTPTAGTCSGSTFTVTVTVKYTPQAPSVDVTNNCDGSSDLTASNYSGALLWSYNNATTASIHVTTGGVYTVKQTVNGCPSANGSGTAAPKTNPAKPSIVVTQPSLCGPAKGSIQVCNPDSRYTYSIGATSIPGSGGTVVFSNLEPGSNPSVIAVYQGCSSVGATCTDAVSSCPPSAPVTQKSTADQTTSTAIEGANSLQKAVPVKGIRVQAFPNPFLNRASFVVATETGGYGSLDLYNLLGQKVKTVYQGMLQAGTQTFSLNLPGHKSASLVYRLTMNGQQVSGKLTQLQ